MTLEEFAKKAGVKIIDCGPQWGGRVGYKTADSPNCTMCGYRTVPAAYKGWLKETFGNRTAKAVLELIKETT